MKIKCPKCGKELYTNPFWTNHTIDCPYCQTHFVRRREAEVFMIRYFLADTLVMLLLAAVVTYAFDLPVFALILLFNLLCDFMFEVPQHYLERTGQLKYEEDRRNRAD